MASFQSSLLRSLLGAIVLGAPAAAQHIQWDDVSGRLQAGWDLPRMNFHVGEPILLTLRLRMVDEVGPPVEVYSFTQLDPFQVDVFFGPKRRRVEMTAAGFGMIHPTGFTATRGGGLTVHHRFWREVHLTDWWNVSLPGEYTVVAKYRLVAAPTLVLRIAR